MATVKETIKKILKQTDDDLFLGVEPKIEEIIEIVDYTSPKMQYKVTNILVGNEPVILNGTCVETFIGSYNKQARLDLKAGKKEVTTVDHKGNPLYKIEVLD